VIVDGKIVMKNRKLLTLDEEKIVEAAKEAGPKVDARIGLKIGPRWPVV
jgi:hypothetical protein